MVKISIIVPVYNCAPYLAKCVDSILAQTEKDIQVILVNDGSTDGSGTICDAYAAQDSRVTVIHQENAGVSAARNAGIAAAAGDYIGFVDADDWIAPEMFAQLYQQARSSGSEIVMCDAITVWENGRQESDTIHLLEESCILTKPHITPEILRLIAGSVWRCLYQANLLSNKGIQFPVDLKFSEDRMFNLHAMGAANQIAYIKEGFYFRFIRPGSATTSIHQDLFDVQLRAYAHAEKVLLTHWGEDYLPIYQKMLIIDAALMQIYQICSSSEPHKLHTIQSIVQHNTLTEVFSNHTPKGLREQMLAKKQALLLYLTGILWNLKGRIRG